ncbi:transcription factor TFIIIC, tau55 subunit [Cyberlindnera jadinii NRRL Y-1542]|uniref:Transcription factor TFIIIC, tau55 subunit n=1 Tax=Cyberlindnera jadinii (strain ATCC 18201 / CBS 1600 / BCRC 20928 / JCM 3617 / NBRC 0987 / NRRL Y-1542) TaxID=983966 RepID=A0A1E4S9X2_CYBJN|nr:transcription factor TFIIIC, tau55 subunit [Cyberlindnera jadinii NRRL Y-1542]ODV76301.1 transcription factor TFIIIC, tau55 subunit [Cyberlindnera jadinii NRRL Y-1542]
MTLKTIYIARHGYRSNWLPPPHPKPVTGIDGDPPLAEHGLEQAQELAHYILSIQPQPSMIFSSPFYRCLQTATPIAQLLDCDIVLENGIGEWYKPDRPTIPKPADCQILSQWFPNLKDTWSPVHYPSTDGENEEQIMNRCKVFLSKFIPTFEEKYPEIETVLFVTHAATKIALGMSLLGFSNVRETIDDEDTRLRAGSCSLDEYQLDKEGKWEIVMNGNCEFLTEGEEMHWDFLNAHEAGSDADIKARDKRNSKKAEGDEEEYEDVYVTLDVPSNNFNTSTIPPTAKLQVSGLHTETPLFMVNNDVYQGDWKNLVGTEVAFTEDMEEKYKVSDRIQLHDVNPS